ncbi:MULTISPECIES: di- and tripeptidase [Kocuria]|uniref:Di- and tripeptidase n=1 Tax=Kocuria subflava TaxID=1736139 RepID=A0A846TJ65_9MICC|nr:MULTISPECIES: di- and tripeptidase [Kocuria]NKE08523.1 di- and tripeptidase [Kocuria subflava]
MVFNPIKNAFDDSGKPTQATANFLETTLRVQRPVVLHWVKRQRRQHPNDTPAQIAKRLEKQYVRAVTAGGGATGGVAMVPGIGTVASLGVSAASVGAYLEMTALYAQSIAELHGVSTEDPDKTRAMVMALMLGEDGEALMGQVLAKGGKAGMANSNWGLMLGSGSAQGTTVTRTLHNMFIKRFLKRQSGAFIGRALPFGLGAIVGGGANYALARTVVKSTHEAFGELGSSFPPVLAEIDRAPKFEDDKGGKKGRGRRSKKDESAGELTGDKAAGDS